MGTARGRLSVRRLMAVVAVVGIALGCSDLWQRRGRYQWLAWQYDFRVSQRFVAIETIMDFHRRDPNYPREQFLNDVAVERRAAMYLGLLKRKYESAASHPWLAVPPDPPEPEWLWRSEGLNH